jgi:hypothetical protein
MTDNRPIIAINGSLYTDFSGIKRLFEFYHKAKDYYNTTIYIDFYHLEWFDANLSAIFGSILSKLSTENNLIFSTDLNFLEDNFNVLFRNGFLNSENVVIDEQKSTISFKNFSPSDKNGFVSYLENDLLIHRGMPTLNSDQKEKILESLIEVFCNIQIHSKSESDFFVCGQYYPIKGVLIFTMVDLGVGFLPAINAKTNGSVNNSYDAILWALIKRNTTKTNSPGGLGLSDLYRFLKESNGNLQIITGDTFWSIDLEQTLLKKFSFPNPFVGSILNLVFKYN